MLLFCVDVEANKLTRDAVNVSAARSCFLLVLEWASKIDATAIYTLDGPRIIPLASSPLSSRSPKTVRRPIRQATRSRAYQETQSHSLICNKHWFVCPHGQVDLQTAASKPGDIVLRPQCMYRCRKIGDLLDHLNVAHKTEIITKDTAIWCTRMHDELYSLDEDEYYVSELREWADTLRKTKNVSDNTAASPRLQRRKAQECTQLP